MPARLASVCRATADSVRATTDGVSVLVIRKEVDDGADRDTVSKLHRSYVEDSSARRSPLGLRSERRPL